MKKNNTTICCDRCGREAKPIGRDFEHQEFIHIAFRAGYGSVFGDSNYVLGDFCQYCLKAMLGPYLRITLYDKEVTESKVPVYAYQPNQLQPKKEITTEHGARPLTTEELLEIFGVDSEAAQAEWAAENPDPVLADDNAWEDADGYGPDERVLDRLCTTVEREFELVRTQIANLERLLAKD